VKVVSFVEKSHRTERGNPTRRRGGGGVLGCYGVEGGGGGLKGKWARGVGGSGEHRVAAWEKALPQRSNFGWGGKEANRGCAKEKNSTKVPARKNGDGGSQLRDRGWGVGKKKMMGGGQGTRGKQLGVPEVETQVGTHVQSEYNPRSRRKRIEKRPTWGGDDQLALGRVAC